ncbi:MAG: hypothetical protein ABJA84_02010 [Polaromonas sp.]
MFETPCSPTGTGTATHYITEGLIDAQFAALLPLTTIVDGVATTTPGNAEYLWGACQQGAAAQAGFVLTATFADVQALLSQGDVSEQGPFEALARLGLQLIQVAP